ncbi:uncharacterized protein IL334_003587 [Kwoniella shivajii]|uniref:Uncharacterized protein n=1 Tax=Kwoniella shivajii TaxID=564305 RepID=A0ABZ1CYI5_9TREE|nr:hypothetical protein IL334_003587 [Kwoniella shivajii]
MNAISLAILAILPFLARLKAQEASANGGPDLTQFPEWVTNDYDCVIGCLSGFNDTITTIPLPDLESSSFGCASSSCQGDGTGNYYQTRYYIQLFYATGSIYEWADSAPDGYKHATFTWGEAEQQAQSSASAEQATASDPWSADVAEATAAASGGGTGGLAVVSSTGTDGQGASTTGGESASAAATDGVSSAPGETGSHTQSSAKSATSSAIPTASGSTNGTKSGNGTTNGNGTADGNGSSDALPAMLTGLGGLGIHGLVCMVVGLVSLGLGGVVTGL